MQKHQTKKYWVFLFTSVQLDKLPDNKQIRKKSSKSDNMFLFKANLFYT